jgi:DNA-binding transcriptional LysR family regulator
VDCRTHQHPELRRSTLFHERYVVVAAPSFLEAYPVTSPRDLELLPVLSADKAGAWWDRLLQALPGPMRPELARVVEINHLRGIIRAAGEGLGVGLVPRYAVLEELAAGALEAVLPEVPLREDSFCLYQLASFAHRETNRLVAGYLASLDVTEYGGAL